MTDYLYIASDIPLRTGVIDGRVEGQQQNEFPNASRAFFRFYGNQLENEDKEINSIKHFSITKTKYETFSMSSLPDKKKLEKNLKTHSVLEVVKVLKNYIDEHFEKGSQIIVILFCLNDHQNEPLKEQQEIKLQDLELKDLYYAERRMLTILK